MERLRVFSDEQEAAMERKVLSTYRWMVSEDYVFCCPAKNYTSSALLEHEACSSRRRHEAAEEVRALLAGLNFIIYGMMLACIAQCHFAITNNIGASVHC